MVNRFFFSIICPFFNSEAFLASAIISVLSQSYPNFEFILIDDGSTDSSGVIADEFAKRDSRIRVIHKANEGQAKARFDGVCLAKGNYLLFLDSDDEYIPGAFDVLYKQLKNTSLDLLVYNAKIIDHKTNKSVYEFDLNQIESPLVECFFKRRVSYFWSICIKKETFLNIDENTKQTFLKLRYSEDLYLIYNIVKTVQKDKFLIIDEELYKYIYNPFSITNNQTSLKLIDRFFVFNYVYEDLFHNYSPLFKLISKSEKDSAGWTYLSAARKLALEVNGERYFNLIKMIRTSFLFKHLNNFKKDRFSFIAYILLKIKMYRLFKKYIIKHESNKK